jgi:hypothetical protein
MTHEPSPFANDETYFGRTEISESTPRSVESLSIEDLTARCTNFCGAQGFFARREQELAQALSLAYALYIRIRWDSDAIERLRKHPLFQDRVRAPSKANAAHLAMLLVCRPANQAQRKMCSDYASALVWASDQNVHPKNFIQAWHSTTLAKCKEYVRGQRRAVKRIRTDSQATKNSCEPCIEIRIADGADRPLLLELSISADQFELIRSYKAESRTGTSRKRATAAYLMLLCIQSSIRSMQSAVCIWLDALDSS